VTHQKIVSCICKAFARLCGKDGLTELLMKTTEQQEEKGQSDKGVKWFFSLVLGIAYIVAAICALEILPPLPVNPIYYR